MSWTEKTHQFNAGTDCQRLAQSLACCGGLVLLAVTWRLWTPQNVFPRIPLLNSVVGWPEKMHTWITWWALFFQCFMLALLMIRPTVDRLSRWAFAILALAFGIMMLLDQHRMQPWAFHIGLTLFLLLFSPLEHRLDRICWFHASIYLYSALGKLDAQFLYTVGQDFVRVAWQMFGMNWDSVPSNVRFWMATALPIGELFIGLLLVRRPTRSLAAIGAIFMHATLIGLLGPWGLRHGWGVILWNLLFLLLVGTISLRPLATSTTSRTRGIWISDVVLMAVLVAPLGERFGWVDHWLGWALYAPHSSRAQIVVLASATDNLPEGIRPFVFRDDRTELWCHVRIDRWSLEVLSVPIYPQQRFQFGVAKALAGFVEDGDIRVQLLGTADRWTGRRKERWLNRRTEMLVADKYWFNTTPVLRP